MWYGACVNYPPRPGSGRASDRLPLSRWLRTATDHILRVQYAKAVGNPDVVPDLTDAERMTVLDADSKDRNAAAKMILDLTTAPHARWEPERKGDDTPRALGSDWRRPSIEELEERLAALADDGDRSAILAMLAALDPARYGPPGKTLPPGDHTVDTVDFSPAIVTKA
jgi:hypothetical protein